MNGDEDIMQEEPVSDVQVYFEEEPVETEEPVVEEHAKDPSNKPCITKPTNKPKEVGNYAIGLPASSLVEFTTALNRFSEILTESNKDHVKWRDTSQEATEFYTPGGLYQDRLDDGKANWQQGVISPSGDVVGMSSVAMKSREGELKGEIALLKVAKRLGMGEVVNVMLPHSGIWLTVKPPPIETLLTSTTPFSVRRLRLVQLRLDWVSVTSRYT